MFSSYQAKSESERDRQRIASAVLPPLNQLPPETFKYSIAKIKYNQTCVCVFVYIYSCTHGKIFDIIKCREWEWFVLWA